MSSVLSGKVVLVTGGTGSIGGEIVRQALLQGAERVVVFSRDEIKHFMMRKKYDDARLQTVVGDVADARSLERVFALFGIDVLYHAAAMKHVVMCEEFPSEAVKTNVLGTQNVVDLAVEHRVAKVITISTDKAAYPVNVLGSCKAIAERITLNANRVSSSDQVFSCVRFGNVSGSRGSVIPVLVSNLVDKKPLRVSDPQATRFMIRIEDAVRLTTRATELARGGEIFLLKMRALKLADLIDAITGTAAPRLGLSRSDFTVEECGLVAGEKLHEDLMNATEASRLFELEDMYVVLPDTDSSVNYPAIRRATLSHYSSCEADLISGNDIEAMVLEYLEERSTV